MRGKIGSKQHGKMECGGGGKGKRNCEKRGIKTHKVVFSVESRIPFRHGRVKKEKLIASAGGCSVE